MAQYSKKPYHGLDRSHDDLDSDDAYLDEMDGEAPPSPKVLKRDDVLASLGYKSDKLPTSNSDLSINKEGCRRCGKKVYPVERIDVGMVYHKSCFRCSVCSRVLNIKTFQLHHDGKSSRSKDIFCAQHVPQLSKANISQDALEIRQALNAQKQREIKRYEGEEYHLTPDDLQYVHSRQIKEDTKRRKVKRHSSLRTYKDFEMHGVFEAQRALEAAHREEEDELYSQISTERRAQLTQLQQELEEEKQRTVKQLVTWFEQQGKTKQERQAGLRQIEQFYKQKREEQTRILLQKLAVEEQAAVARMIEKHSQEMLKLIADKDREAEAKQEGGESKAVGSTEAGLTTHVEEEEDNAIVIDVDILPGGGMKIGKPRFPNKKGPSDDVTVDSGNKTSQVKVPTGTRDESENYHHADQHTVSTSSIQTEPTVQDKGTLTDDELIDDSPPLQRRKPPKSRQGDIVTEPRKSKQEDRELAGDDDAESGEESGDSWEDDWENTLSQLTERVTGKSQHKAQNVHPYRKKKHGSLTVGPGQIQPDPIRVRSKTDRRRGDFEEKHSENVPHDRSGEQNIKDSALKRRQGKSPRRDQSPAAPKGHRSQESIDSLQEGDSRDSWPSIDEAGRPTVMPPKSTKSHLYKSVEVFSELDTLAIKEAKRDHTTFTDLVRQLTMTCHTELQRVRAIFRWITAKDLNALKFDKEFDADSPMGLLRGIKSGTESYHNLFKRLCSYAGLHCEILEGYSKGAGYRPGTKFRGDFFRNQWTAVWVEGSWHFINCNWGARHVKGPKDDLMTYKCDEFYFLTDPKEHIYQHFPDEEKWQLLKEPITMDGFLSLPVVKSPFFNASLRFSKKYDAILEAPDSTVDIVINAPHLMSFAAKLKSRDKRMPPELLQNRTMVRVVNKQVVTTAILPSPGSYYIDIYCAKTYGSESMDNICSFQLRCPQVPGKTKYTLPPIGCYGVTPGFSKFGLKEKSHQDPFISVTGNLDISYSLSQDIKLYHGLKLWNGREKKMSEQDRYAMLKYRSDNSAIYTICFPQRGTYIFMVYATFPDKPSSEMECVYRHVIDCRSSVEHPHSFPKISRRWRDCKLIEPLCGDLVTKSRIRFTLEMPAALQMVVSVGDKWYSLKKSESRGLWQGHVFTGEKGGKASLYCQLDPTNDKYIPLLEYSIKEASLSDEVRQLYKYV